MVMRTPSSATTPNSSSSTNMAPSPPSSISSYDNQDEWTVPTTAPSNHSSYQSSMSWQSSEPYGLGISSCPSTIAAPYYDASQPYPPAYSLQPNPSYLGAFRKYSVCGEECDPRTMPQFAMWGPAQVSNTNLAFDASPSLSSYSNSSKPSTMSSPYHPSDDYTGGSPMVKVEEPSEQHMSATAYYQDTRPIHVHPGALVNIPIDDNPYYHHHNSDMEMVDVKPEFESPKTTRQPSRTASVEEQIDEIMDRKRSYTKPENANCACEQCGKLFQRSFNLRAHMQTHDPERTQNYQCSYPKCEKRFVRRTDLIRHEQSVHIKSQIFRCPLCDSCFARRDTLRRHVGDGCPRRPEVKRRGSRNFCGPASTPVPVAVRS